VSEAVLYHMNRLFQTVGVCQCSDIFMKYGVNWFLLMLMAIAGYSFYQHFSVTLFVCTISQKPLQLGSPNLT